MGGIELSQSAHHWTIVVLIWLGLGIVAGLLAKFLLPGRRPAGAAGTLVLGIIGSTLGPLVVSLLQGGKAFNPVGPLGLLSAVAGALATLVAYRVFVLWRLAPYADDGLDP